MRQTSLLTDSCCETEAFQQLTSRSTAAHWLRELTRWGRLSAITLHNMARFRDIRTLDSYSPEEKLPTLPSPGQRRSFHKTSMTLQTSLDYSSIQTNMPTGSLQSKPFPTKSMVGSATLTQNK